MTHFMVHYNITVECFCVLSHVLGYHGTQGPLVVSDVNVTDLRELFIQAGGELGYPEVDINGETQEGIIIILPVNILIVIYISV